MISKQGIKGAKRLLAWQLGVNVVAMLLSSFFISLHAGFSAFLGGLVSIIPNAYFAWRLFRYHGAKAARKIVNNFYKGEAAKIVLTLALFALIFTFIKVEPVSFFITFIMVQMVFWFAPLIFDNKNRPKSD